MPLHFHFLLQEDVLPPIRGFEAPPHWSSYCRINDHGLRQNSLDYCVIELKRAEHIIGLPPPKLQHPKLHL